jgi:hypothetical protein
MTALWLLADAVVGEAPPQDEADMEALYDALQTVTWFIDDLDPDSDSDSDSDPGSEAFLAAVEKVNRSGGGSSEGRARQGTVGAPSPSPCSPWRVTPS